GEHDLSVNGSYEPNRVVISGEKATRKEMLVYKFTCTIPEDIAPGKIQLLQAAEARYVPPSADPKKKRAGGWLMTGTEPAELPDWPRPDVLEPIAPGKYFLYTSEV